MKRIFVCSPLRPRLPESFQGSERERSEELTKIFEANKNRAREYCRRVVLAGHLPYAPHLFFTQFLDEFSPRERALGIEMGIIELKACDELWYWDHPTEGMKKEIKFCHAHGIRVVHWVGNAPVPLGREETR